jgi:anti-sigma factor RsiW
VMADKRAPFPDDDVACVDEVEMITDYLEGALPEAERHRLEAHISHCEGCTEYLEQMRTVAGSLGDLREDAIPPDMRAAVLGAFRSQSKNDP